MTSSLASTQFAIRHDARSALVALTGMLALVGCATDAHPPSVAASQTLLPGVLDLPLIEGSHIAGECASADAASSPTVCVAYPRESERDWQGEYVTALRHAGWQFVGGAGPVFWFERPIDRSECSQRLDMLGWILGDPGEMAKLGTAEEPNIDWSKIPNGLWVFTVARDPVCHDARHAQ